MNRKVPVNLSLDYDEYQKYRIALRGTRFEENASAAIRCHIQCVVEADEQRKREEVIAGLPTETSYILETKNEYLDKFLKNFALMDNEDIVSYILDKRDGSAATKFQQITRELEDRWSNSNKQASPEVEVSKTRKATEQEKAMLRHFEGLPEQEVISAVKKLRKQVEEGTITIV